MSRGKTPNHLKPTRRANFRKVSQSHNDKKTGFMSASRLYVELKEHRKDNYGTFLVGIPVANFPFQSDEESNDAYTLVAKAFTNEGVTPVQCEYDTTMSDLCGKLTPDPLPANKGKFYFLGGPLTGAMRDGNILLLENVDRLSDEILDQLEDILLPDKPSLLVGEYYNQAETLVAHPDFFVVLAMAEKPTDGPLFNILQKTNFYGIKHTT